MLLWSRNSPLFPPSMLVLSATFLVRPTDFRAPYIRHGGCKKANNNPRQNGKFYYKFIPPYMNGVSPLMQIAD